MKVLVTGNLGYIGPVVTAALKRAGHYVIGLDTGWFLPNYASVPEYPDEQLFGDIRTALTPRPQADVIVHLAGLSNDPMGDLDPALTSAINLSGTGRVIQQDWSRRHVVVSSCSVYGTSGMATEQSEMNPLTWYASAKAGVDNYLAEWSYNAVSLRLGTVYGYSPGHRLDLVVNQMTYDAVHGRPITVTGNAARPLVHVEDVARAIVFMLDRPETGIYNVVGENWRMADLGHVIAEFVGAPIESKPAGADARDYMADGSKLRGLGWESRYYVGGSLPVLAEKSLTLSGPPSRYKRLNALRHLIDSGVLTSDLRRKDPIAA